MANTKKQFVPLTNIKCIKNVGFGFQLGILYEGLDYDAEKFREKDGLILFTLSDKKGWIGDYMVETKNFLIK